MKPITQTEFDDARSIVYETLQPTLQHRWPLLCQEMGCEVWLKHENHTPTGAFKVRGGLVYMRRRVRDGHRGGVITASTGNHGQSVPFAAGREGIAATVVVPTTNALGKNASMRALGAELVETGDDFNVAKQVAEQMAAERNLHMIASFHRDLVMGVATYAHELFDAAGELDAVYVPIGLGSGICGVITARDLLGLKTKIIGVVPTGANSYALSFAQDRPVPINRIDTIAEGIAVCEPNAEAVQFINTRVERMVEISDDAIKQAMRTLYSATHNVAEPSGAAALAALMQEKEKNAGKRVGVILSGGNVDADRLTRILAA